MAELRVSFSPRVLAMLFVIATSLFAASGVDQNAGKQDQPGRTQTVLRRTLVIGTSEHTREMAEANPEGQHFHRNLSEVRVEERPVPKACGTRAAKLFRGAVVSKFKVPAKNSCFVSDETVDCATHDLPGYSQLFLALTYNRTQTDLDLTVTVQQRGFWGAVRNPRLSDDHAVWFESIFDCLVSVAECGREPPQCSRPLTEEK